MAGPLEGIRVIDLGHDWACPHAARVLADFGADVIKIEYLRRLDGMRGGFRRDGAYNRHARFFQLHRNKRSVTLDLRDAAERTTFLDLVRVSDIVMENARTGVLDRLGLGYDVLREVKPDIILVSMTAFGETGPEAAYAGYGGTIEAVSGIQSLTAYAHDDAPRRIREMDVTNGILGACAALTALLARQRTGQAQRIDLSEMEAASSGLIGEHLLEYAVNGTQTLPLGNRHPEHAPQGCYRCAGEDRWVTLAVRSEHEWAALCKVLDSPEWQDDPRFVDARARARHHDELDRLIEGWTCTRTPDDVMRRLQEAGVPAGAVLDAADLAIDPHLESRAFFQSAADGSGRFPGFPVRLSAGGGEVRHRGPDLGADNVAVRCDLLGASPGTIAPIDETMIGTAFDVQ